jgi:hypothetical protein
MLANETFTNFHAVANHGQPYEPGNGFDVLLARKNATKKR